VLINNRKGSKLDAGTETSCCLNQELCYHFLGTDQSEDILCWRDLDHPNYIYTTEVTLDGKVSLPYLELYVVDIAGSTLR